MVRTILSVLCVEFSGGRIWETSWADSRHKSDLRIQFYLFGLSGLGWLCEGEREREREMTHSLATLSTIRSQQNYKQTKSFLLPSSLSLSLHLPLSLSKAKSVQSGSVCYFMTQRLNLWNDITNLIYFTRVQRTSYIKYMPICRCVSTQKLNKQTRIFPTRYYLCLCNLEFNVVIKNNCSRFLSNKVWVIQTLALLIWYSRLESADCESEKSYHGVIKNFTSADERLPSFRRD